LDQRIGRSEKYKVKDEKKRYITGQRRQRTMIFVCTTSPRGVDADSEPGEMSYVTKQDISVRTVNE